MKTDPRVAKIKALIEQMVADKRIKTSDLIEQLGFVSDDIEIQIDALNDDLKREGEE